MIGTIVIALTGWYLAEHNRLPQLPGLPRSLRYGLMLITLATIAIFWIFMPGTTFLPAIALFRIYIVAVLSGVVFVYLYASTDHDILLPAMVWRVLFITGVILAVTITVRYIGRIPASLYYDEPLVANYGWTCARDYVTGVEMLPPRDTDYLRVAIPIVYCIPGFFMKYFGTTLAIARLQGILIIWLAAPLIYFMAKRLYGIEAAIIATIVMLLFPLMHNHLRSDPYVAFILTVSLYCYTRAREHPAWYLHFLTGFALAFSIDAHQLGLRFVPVFGLLYLWDYIRAIREQKRFMVYRPFFIFAIGGFFYAGIFYVLHVIYWANTDLTGALELINVAYDEQLTVGGNVGFWQRILNNISPWFIIYVVRHPVEMLILSAGMITAVRQFQESDRFLLYIFWLSWILYFFISPKPTPYYLVHHLPLVALFAGNFVHSTVKNGVHPASVFPVLVVLVFFTANILLASQSGQNADRLMDISFDIDAQLPEDVQMVTGHQVYFWGLAYRDFYDANTFAKHTVDEAIAEWGISPPDAIVWSVGLDEHAALSAYIESQQMVAARCYPTWFFGGQTILYVLPQFAEQVEHTTCNR